MYSTQDLFDSLRQTQLNDPEAVTFPDAMLLTALNESLRTLILVRPDASSKNMIIDIQSGARQTLPTDGIRLLSVTCNINTDLSRGRIIRLVQKEDLDSASYSWMSAQGSSVKEYMFDSRYPAVFYIYPNVPTGTQIEIEYSASLEAVTLQTIANTLPVSSIFAQPLKEMMLYMLLSGDATNGTTGDNHLQTAMQLLGVKDLQDERLSTARKTET